MNAETLALFERCHGLAVAAMAEADGPALVELPPRPPPPFAPLRSAPGAVRGGRELPPPLNCHDDLSRLVAAGFPPEKASRIVAVLDRLPPAPLGAPWVRLRL